MSHSNSNVDIWIAGAVAAFSVDLLVYPLDTLKTRMQSPDYKKLYTNGAEKGINRAMFRGVYQGIGSIIIATLPSCMMRLTSVLCKTDMMQQERSSPHTKASSQSSRTTILQCQARLCFLRP